MYTVHETICIFSREDSVVLGWFSRMDSLMHLVHCVFVGHGYQNERNEDSKGRNIRPLAVAATHRSWECDGEKYLPLSQLTWSICGYGNGSEV